MAFIHLKDAKMTIFMAWNWLHWGSVLFFLLVFPSCSEVLSNLKAEINKSKEMKVAAARPLILAAEENLHNMTVDLDKVVTKVWKIFDTILLM